MISFRCRRSSRPFCFPIYVLALAAYFGKSIYLYFTTGFLNIGKDIVVATTAVCWYVGIVFFNSDYAFTVTNVIIHGVPYFALIYVYARDFGAKRAERMFGGFYLLLEELRPLVIGGQSGGRQGRRQQGGDPGKHLHGQDGRRNAGRNKGSLGGMVDCNPTGPRPANAPEPRSWPFLVGAFGHGSKTMGTVKVAVPFAFITAAPFFVAANCIGKILTLPFSMCVFYGRRGRRRLGGYGASARGTFFRSVDVRGRCGCGWRPLRGAKGRKLCSKAQPRRRQVLVG